MAAAPIPANEDSRLSCLQALGVLDMGRDDWLDALAFRALSLFPGTHSAAVSLVARDWQLFKARTGLDLLQTPRAHSFCAYAILGTGCLVIEDATRDERFLDNPLVTGAPGIRFYAGAPLRDNVGTLCIIGLEPRQATHAELEALTTVATTVDQRLALHAAIRALAGRIPLH